MATNLTITPADVIPAATPSLVYPCGETIAGGEVAYIDSSNKLMKANASMELTSLFFALVSGVLDQPVPVLQLGQCTISAVMSQSVEYYLSPDSGKITTRDQLVSTNYVYNLGIALSSSLLYYQPIVRNVQVP